MIKNIEMLINEINLSKSSGESGQLQKMETGRLLFL